MERVETVAGVVSAPPLNVSGNSKLLRILGVWFGLAIVVGGTIGVGILRSPGPIAEHLGSVWLIMLAWVLGGVYALLGANYLAELATMLPKAGGYFVYSHRAYGPYGGFVVGWSDWLYNTLALSFIAVVFGEYTVSLFGLQFSGARVSVSVAVLLILAAINWIGLRSGSGMQKLTSLLKCAALIAFVVACFLYGDQGAQLTSLSSATGSVVGVVALVLAFQMVMSTYDGWHSAIYFTEEDTNPNKNLPRAMFAGIGIIIAIYLLVNIALFYVLPVSQLAGSQFAGGDAIKAIFGLRGSQIITILALLSLLGILNAIMMMSPRMLLALGREGLCTQKAAVVNKGGSPGFALAMTVSMAIAAAGVGSFETLLAVSQFFAVVITILSIGALFVLRRNEPELPRPFRTWGYPAAPLVMLAGAVLLFFGYIYSNPYPSMYALAALAVSVPVYKLVRKKPLV